MSKLSEEFKAWGDKMAAATASTQKREQVQLPIWSEPERVLPNAMLRSALFGCARHRRFVKEEPVLPVLTSWPDTEIRFHGQTFNQFDESVWMQLIHLFRLQGEPEDFKVRFNARPFLRGLGGGRCAGGSNVGRLLRSLIRLRGGTLLISYQGVEYGGGILNDFTHDKDQGHFVATLNPKYLHLMSVGYTRMDWETRQRLPTGLATWMHRYVLSHRATQNSPHRISLTQLHELSGMRSPLKEFRRQLKRAMERLQKHQIVLEWQITSNDALEFARPPTKKRRTKALRKIEVT